MKFISLVESLKKGVLLAERSTGRNLTLPILSNILLKTEKSQLKISATDLEIGLNIYINGKIEEESSIAIPAKTFSNFLVNLSEEKISLITKENTLKVKSGNYEATIQGLPADDFPIIPKIKSDKYLELENEYLFEALNQILNSAGFSSGRSELNGVYFDFNEDRLKLVTTDSFRLSEKTINNNLFKGNLKEEKIAIVPLRTAQEVLKISQDLKSETGIKVKIYFDPNQVLFDFGQINLISRLVEGNYPKYENIIPQKFETKLFLNKKSLIEAIKIAGLFSSKINDIKLIVKPDQKEILLESQDINLGESQAKVEAKIEGEALVISFNYRYLLDGLNNLSGQMIFLGLNQDINPALIKNPDDNSYLYILMPIKV